MPVALLMLNLSYFIYDSIMAMFEWSNGPWLYYATFFDIFLLGIVFIAAEIKNHKFTFRLH
jgi:spore germination protein KB